MIWTKPQNSLGKIILLCSTIKLKVLFNTLLHGFFHSIVTDYNASCLLELEAVSNACFFFLPKYFKPFQYLFKCASMLVSWGYVPIVKMVLGSLGAHDNLCGRARKNRAGDSLWSTDALHLFPLLIAPQGTQPQTLCLNELMEPGCPQLFTCEGCEAKWPPWICRAHGRCQPFCSNLIHFSSDFFPHRLFP